MSADLERNIIKSRWPEEWRDGARCGFFLRFPGQRETGGYPLGFHRWPLDRRSAWYAGFNVGFHDRLLNRLAPKTEAAK
jgi:hypothetical protein